MKKNTSKPLASGNNTMSCNNTVMNFLYDVFGRYELQALLAKYDITGICSPRRFRFLARN